MGDYKMPSMAKRIELNDIAKVEVNQQTGMMTITNSFLALAEWAAAGLDITLAELGAKYSDEDIKRIGSEVKAMAGNPFTD